MEVWRDVIGFEGAYQVSNHGRVRSLDRGVGNRTIKGRVMSPSLAGHKKFRPYYRILLRAGGQSIGVYVHQLVAWAFLGEQPEGTHVHHRNGVATDNRASNLAYLPATTHHREHTTGERNPAAVLTVQQVRAIREHLDAGAVGTHLARQYGVSKATIYQIGLRRIWATVE